MHPLIILSFSICLAQASAPAPVPTAARLGDPFNAAFGDADAPDAEESNLIKLARIYDAMVPESVAPLLKSMAGAGPDKLNQVAAILNRMKEKNAARLLEAMEDPALVSQLLDRIRDMRTVNKLPVAPAPRLAKK